MIGYLIIGGVGFLFLIISFVLAEIGDFFGDLGDHDFHVDVGDNSVDIGGHDSEIGSGPGFLNMRSIVAFITGFGAVGALCMHMGWTAAAASLPAVATGLVMALIVWGFSVLLYRQQGSSNYSISKMVGRSGLVITRIPEGGGLGSVMINTNSGTVKLAARTDDNTEIKEGYIVYVENIINNTAVVSRDKQ